MCLSESPAPAERPFVVVLTGGIASGKTAASDHFASLGVPVIDTDIIARELVEPGQAALQRIKYELGPGFLDSSGRLDRDRMRKAIFANSNLKARLESILHPLIAEEAERRLANLNTPYCILVIPLYAESARWSFVDHVVVVDVDEETQIERVMIRDGIDRPQARAILDAQSSRVDRLALAHDVIDNTGTLQKLQEQVDVIHERILASASTRG
ncbi:MAG: dephospho-CoA kinase [Xanthomonadales bacterium]|jgi:dephospho-CoA kinase|nr:dephospho-CoA kinase [Xanthomonadales bacterium]